MQSPARRAILIGMDGASMELVNNMVDGGHMPHLGRLMERAVHRPMIGVFPTLTPPRLDGHCDRRLAGQSRHIGFQHSQAGRPAG